MAPFKFSRRRKSSDKSSDRRFIIVSILLGSTFILVLALNPMDPKEAVWRHRVSVSKEEGDSYNVVDRRENMGGRGRVFYMPKNAADSLRHIKNGEWFGEFKHDTLILTIPKIGPNRTVTFIHDITFPKVTWD